MLIRREGVVLGQLGADDEPKKFYALMSDSEAFKHPIRWSEINPSDYNGLLLCGGHAPGMKQYLENEELQQKVSAFWCLDNAQNKRPVAAICHGVLLLSRCK
jgi:putative intracellular protease/amidase